MQLQCLQLKLCIVSFVFSKVKESIVQFLCQLGVPLIIYVDDPVKASVHKSRLLEDFSAVLWLLTALWFLINLPKGNSPN